MTCKASICNPGEAVFCQATTRAYNSEAVKDPVLFLSNPNGITRERRRQELDVIGALDREQQAKWGDPEIDSKINQYEMAYRMQSSVPEITDFSNEPEYIFDMYGEDARKPGTFAANCLLARRLAERDVPFVQLYHSGMGPTRQPAERYTAHDQIVGPSQRGAHQGPQTAWFAGRHPGRLGR